MRVALLTTYERSGGAARAAWRQHTAMVGAGVDSRVLCLHAAGRGGATTVVEPTQQESLDAAWSDMVHRFGVRNNRTGLTNTWFSLPLSGADEAVLEACSAVDVINLHWSAGLVSPRGLERLAGLGKPIVYTLHDTWPLTGGCHYPAGCGRWELGCGGCPQLLIDTAQTTAAVAGWRAAFGRAVAGAGLGTVVTPSRWLGEMAAKSPATAGWHREVVPYGVDLGVFRPMDRGAARASFGLGAEDRVVLFVADNTGERRKGFAVLHEALRRLIRESKLRPRVLVVGADPAFDPAVSESVVRGGHLSDDARIAAAYSAADCYALPTLEDNLPNTMLESLACGTPVVGTRVGGVGETIEPGVTGELADPGDAASLAKALRRQLSAKDAGGRRERARAFAESCYSMESHGRRWAEVLEQAVVRARAGGGVSARLPERGEGSAALIRACAVELTVSVLADAGADGAAPGVEAEQRAVTELRESLASARLEADRVRHEASQRLRALCEAERLVERLQEESASRLGTIRQAETTVASLVAERDALREQASRLRAELGASASVLSSLREESAERLRVIRDAETLVRRLSDEREELIGLVRSLETGLTAANDDRAARLEVIRELERRVEAARVEIEALERRRWWRRRDETGAGAAGSGGA